MFNILKRKFFLESYKGGGGCHHRHPLTMPLSVVVMCTSVETPVRACFAKQKIQTYTTRTENFLILIQIN